ncbi:MAG TPA: hypothetical protein ENH65_13815 [Candidatus Aminicenantes bacterium]|nr:hypothetical protein [Candidatus Aminicenantes bacterium]HEB34724.1 hypothetical protein [Candidatus Aminicenantes bacterium]
MKLQSQEKPLMRFGRLQLGH